MHIYLYREIRLGRSMRNYNNYVEVRWCYVLTNIVMLG